MKPPRHLTQSEIKLLIDTAVQSGLLEIDRHLRLDGIDPAVVLSLKTTNNPLHQFQLDLQSLGNIVPGRGEEAALVRFLKNAAFQLQLSMRSQGEIFERYAVRIGGTDKVEPSSPPFVLGNLVDGVDVRFVPIPLVSPATPHDLFFLSSGPVPVGRDEDAMSVETDGASFIRWLTNKRSNWPIRPPRAREWKAAFVAGRESNSALPITLPPVAEGRRFWCLEEDRLLSRAYDGRLVDSRTADVWLIYEM
jgi:hypothetical protein